ncbi:HNH endonuclease, partial [Sedimenticola sp.]|uniref:HNH endonuclease n=1 Tax=Sedimenticola sp. TaxID=1940285 RepID=UPI003D11B001
DINTSSNSSEHMNTNVSMSVYGGSGASVSASADRSQGGSTDIIHTNSQLQGNNIRLKTRDTTTIAGANVAAADTLNIETKHLNVESVQDSHESRSAGEGINVSGAAGSVPGSGGINGSVSHSRSRETVLTTLTGGNVDINVAEDTTLTGATIAAIDENGEDNGQLNFQTGTLQVNALSNTGYSTSTSANIGAGQTVSIDASSDTSHSKTKTLGTIGEGNIHVANIDDSDTKLLNRDVTDNEVDIYSIESHKGLKGSLDTRFLTEDGRKDVLEDIKRSELLGSALLDVVTEESVRFQDTMQHIGDIQKDLDVQKLLANRDDGVNAKILNDLANATLEEKQQAINAYAAAYAEVYHITIDQALVVTVNAFVGGAHANSGEGSTLYVNDYAQNNALDYTNTLGHEVAHAQMAQDSSLDRGDARLNEEYANLRGEYAADNYEFSFSQNDYGPINTGNTNAYVGNATSETARNNNTQYYSEDRKNLDFSCEMASPTGSCAQLMHDSAITANMMVGNKERAAELIEADVIASLMRTGRTEQLEKVLADASPGAVKEALQLQMSMAQEDKAALAAGGIVLAIVAAPAIPEVLAGMAATGRMAAAEIASFASNPVAYCQLNPALCLSIAEEAGYTSAGATTASSMVPHVPASGVRQAAGEAVAGKVDDVAKDVLSTAKRQGPYDPNKARADLEDVYGAENVTSTTNPKDPLQRVNSDPEKGVEVINGANGSKAVRVEYNDPVTGETVAANVPYNNRGLPVFDDQAKFTTNIDTTKNYDAQFSQATRDLRDAINSGQVDASQFTELQMQQIQAGKSKIKDYTWHHNADSNNMQLVPTNVHEAVNHVGQKSLSSGQ